MYAVLEADMDVIVLYHIKNETLDEGVTYRDLLLQGSILPEVPTWFDVVGVMESYEVIDEEGDTVTRRSFVTAPSRLYPWLKDHSHNMPRRFDISPAFGGDYLKMKKLWLQEPEGSALREVVKEIPSASDIQLSSSEDSSAPVPVPSPEDLEAKKVTPTLSPEAVEEKPPEDEAPIPSPAPSEEQEEKPVTTEEVVPIGNMNEDDEAMDDPPEQEVSLEEAEQNVTEALGAEAVMTCTEEGCGKEIDMGMHDISQIRFRTNLCKEHYVSRLAANE
jgi:hypothetical protein